MEGDYYSSLIELMANFSLSHTEKLDHEIQNLVQLMGTFGLDSLEKSALPDGKDMIHEESETSSSKSEGGNVPLMRFPEHINDHRKLSWMIKDNTPVEMLMSESFSLQDYYLNQYFKLIFRSTSPFNFVQIYPHSIHLKSNKRFRTGELIMQIDKRWFLTKRQFSRTHICRYLRNLASNIQSNTNIFSTNNTREIVKNIQACLKFQDVLYLFQLKFIQDILNIPQPHDMYEQAEWLFFKFLPNSFDSLPINRAQLVQKYHPAIGGLLQDQKKNIYLIFTYLRDIINGVGLKRQYQFKNYLQIVQPDGREIYQRYQKFITFQNYLWASCCERTKVFYSSTTYRHIQYSTIPEEVFIPVLDLFPHSYRRPNIRWEMDPFTENIKVYAIRQIQYGQILSAYYNPMTVQSGYNYFGFVDADSESQFRIPLYYDPSTVCRVIELRFNENLASKIKEAVVELLENSQSYFQLSVSSSFEYKENVIQGILAEFTVSTLKQMVNIAENINEFLQKRRRQVTNNNKNSHLRDCRGKNRSYICFNYLRKDQQLMKKLNNLINAAILSGIQRKRDLIHQIKCELQKQLDFATQYHLMCLHTILHQEYSLLQSVRKSIYYVDKGEEMTVQF